MSRVTGSIVAAASASGQTIGGDGEALVSAGVYTPFYPLEEDEPIDVPAFWLDIAPVTNGQYLEFVEANAQWRRGFVPRVFADAQYLEAWATPESLGDGVLSAAPVSGVSWFAAAAYCEWAGRRLPTEAEWERVGWAVDTDFDGRENPDYVQEILTFYSRPRAEPRPVRGTPPNAWGVHDMHGLHWEWVLDYDASLVTGDNRQDGDQDNSRFCGGASVGAEDTSDYAAFMRFAFRGSLGSTYTPHNLGFRCARDADGSQPEGSQ